MWNRKSCDMSTGESERSELFSSHSDEKEAMTESPTEGLESPEKTSKPSITEDELKESVKILTEKLSAALVNVKAKEDLVKQHAKVAEEAVAGWEKAENEVASIKQQLDLALQQNLNLEVKASHLDGALKECVRQLRQARDEHDKQADLEKQVANLQAEAEAAKAENSSFLEKLEALEKENSSLKQELFSRFDELEIMAIERDLSTEAAEAASKMQLESFKKVAKLEAECRKLQSITRKLSPQKSVETEPLILDLDQFKKEKPINNNLTVKIDMMDDFLEMERLAALDDIKSNAPIAEDINPLRDQLDSMSTRITELEDKLEKIEAEKLELQNALDESLESLKATEIKLEEVQKEIIVVNEAREMLELQIVGLEAEARTVSENVDELKLEIEEKRFASEELKSKCEELENELSRMIQESEIQQNEKSNGELKINELKLEIEEERKVLWSKCRELENELSRTIEEERKVSSELRSKCRELENELSRTIEESALQQNANSNGEVKEDLAVAADKLTECQKTIASLGRQLESLATLEDFLIDTSNIPGLTRGGSPGEDIWRLSSNEMFMPRHEFSRISMENYSHLENGIEGSLPSSSLSAPSMNHSTAAKSRNSFGKFFSRSKNVVEFENGQD